MRYLLVFLFMFDITFAALHAQWRFDACGWSGSAGEVRESVNGYNGTAHQTTTIDPRISGGGLCRSIDFTDDSTADYIVLDHRALDGLEEFTLTTWFRTAKTDWQPLLSAANADEDNEVLWWLRNGNTVAPHIMGKKGTVTLQKRYDDDRWHFMAWRRQGASNCIYIDGELQGCVDLPTGALQVVRGGLILGQEQDSVGGSFDASQNFVGYQDELKIFNSALSDDAIRTIYDNERNGKNWDGTQRECSCYAPFAEYRMDACGWSGQNGEVKDSANGYDGKAVAGATTQESAQTGGGLCRVGSFQASRKQHVEIANFKALGSSRTITAWIYVNDLDVNGRIFADDRNNRAGDYALSYKDGGKRRMRFFIRGLNPVSLDSNAVLKERRWYFVAAVFDADAMKKYLYIFDDSGNLIDQKNVTVRGRVRASEGYASIGGEPASGNEANRMQFDGYIDEVKVFDKALSLDALRGYLANDKNGRNWDGSWRECACFRARAHWRFDECSWSGQKGEVADSSGHDFNGTAQSATTVSAKTLGGGICKVADFTKDSIDDYVSLDYRALHGVRNFTLMTWFRTKKSASQPLLSAANEVYDNEVLWWLRGGNKVYPYIKERYKTITLSKRYDDDKWHFMVWRRKGSENCIYLDGKKEGCVTLQQGQISVALGGLIIGQEQDSVGGSFDKNQNFVGYQDELLVFPKALREENITQIYNNFLAGKNWDGSQRVCCCNDWIPESMFTPLQMQGGWVHIKNTYDDPTWTHVDFPKPFASKPVVFIVTDIHGEHPASARIKNVSRHGFDVTIAEPQGMDGPHVDQNVSYIAVNEGLHKIDGHILEVGTIDTKKIQGLYAQGDKGWEKLTTTARFCEPAILTNIQTLNNEQNPIPKKPSKPWMTAATFIGKNKDIYVALDRSETNDGEVAQPETIGYMVSNADFAGSFQDASGKQIRFEIRRKERYFKGWDNGGCKTIEYLNSYTNRPIAVGWKNSRYGDNGGWFRICQYDQNSIGFVVDEDTARDDERWHVAEDGGIYVFSEPFVVDEENATSPSIRFAIRDIFRNYNDRNISTKLVAAEFNLTLAEIDSNGTYHDDFNGTVCSAIFDFASKRRLSDWNATYWRSGDEVNETRVQLGSAIASKNAFVHLYWIEDAFTSCSGGLHDANETNSSDRFAIRPVRFALELRANVVAGVDFNITAKALGDDAQPARDYNESVGSTFDLNITYSKPLCKNGSFAPDIASGWQFGDGYKRLQTRYSDVNELNLTIEEKAECAQRFAAIDCDDKNVSGYWESNQTRILPATTTLTIAPHHFSVATKLRDYDEVNGFTYLSRDLNMSAKIEFNVTAKNAENTITKNYNALCYAKNGTLRLSYQPLDRPLHTISHELFIDGSYKASGTTDLNNSIALAMQSGYFAVEHNGSMQGSLAFNFDRNFTTPVRAFDFNLTQAGYSDSDGVSGVASLDEQARFYYARIVTNDLESAKSSDSVDVELLVYGEKTGDELLPGWYLMQPHSDNDGNITQLKPKAGFSLGSADLSLSLASSLDGGRYRITINNATKLPSAVIHLDVPSWFWYSYADDKSYSFAPSSDCSRHPCIRYRYIGEGREPIRSGTVTGLHYEQNVTRHDRGVKVFR